MLLCFVALSEQNSTHITGTIMASSCHHDDCHATPTNRLHTLAFIFRSLGMIMMVMVVVVVVIIRW